MAKSKAPRKAGRTTVVPLTSAASGARVIDLIPLPVPLFVAVRTVIVLVKHWYVVLLACLAVYLYARGYGPALIPVTLAAALALPILYWLYIYSQNRYHSPQAVTRAAIRLIQMKRSWRAILEAGGMNNGPKPPRMVGILPLPTRTPGSPRWWRPPRIANEYGTALTFILDTSGVNATARQIEERREYITNAIQAKRVRVRRLRPGYIELTVEWESNLTRSAVANPRDSIHSTRIPTVELDEGVEFELDNHILIVGDSGSGKSNLVWHIKSNLNQYQIPHVLYVIDPKQVELADLQFSPQTHKYADRTANIDAALNDFYDMMMATLDDMKSKGIRKVEFSPEHPLHLLIVDELLLVGMMNRTDVTETKLGQVLIAGRAAGFVVVGCSQLSQVDAVGRVRDLFPQRICMATNSSAITNAVLGPNAEERGARCSEITEAGTGYIYTDAAGTFERFRPPFINDTKLVALGGVHEPPEITTSRRVRGAYVYVLWAFGSTKPTWGGSPDSDPNTPDRPLYVGKAINPQKRFKQHAESQPWWGQVDHSLTDISEKYPTEQAALEAETEMIERLRPIHNLSQRNYSA